MTDAALLGLGGRTALVTGAGMGIGRACALLFARAGADVAVADLDGAAVERVAAEVRRLDRRALAITADARRSEEVTRMLEATWRDLGGLAACVNNVGGLAGQRPRPLLETDAAGFDAIVENNLRATFLCVQAEAQAFVARGVPGAIVNVASVGALRAVRGIAPYGAAKAGIVNLTMNAAIELAPHRIRVNAVAPGTTATEPVRALAAGGRMRAVEAANPLGRLADPEDVAGAVVFLASDLARYVTGHVLVVDGGLSATTPRPAP